MRIEEMPPVTHDWPEHVRLTEPEGDNVRVVPTGDDYQPNYLRIEGDKKTIKDDGARLDTYQSRRLRTIQDLTEDLEAALVRANQAKDGAASIGYFPNEMITVGNEARDLIAMFEEDR